MNITAPVRGRTHPSAAELPENTLRAILSALPGVVLVTGRSPDGALEVIAANDEAETLFGGGGRTGDTPLPQGLVRLATLPLEADRVDDLTLPGGTTLEIRVVALPADYHGRPITLCVGQDVTAQRAVARAADVLSTELQRSNDDLQEFAYVASHDLSEPLRMVSSFVELLSNRYSGAIDERADQYLRFAMEGAHRMRALIDDLLAVAALRDGERQIAAIDLTQTVADVLGDLRGLAASSGATVTVGDLPKVAGDAVQIRQVLQNLLSNSMKFSDRSTVGIAVTADIVNGLCRVAVDDDGIGIDAKHRQRAFQMFTRLNARADFPGNGMGLAMAHRIIESHGGGIWIEPSARGGTRVVFTIPLSPTTDQRNP